MTEAPYFPHGARALAYGLRAKLDRLPGHYLDVIARAVQSHRSIQRRAQVRHRANRKAAPC